MGQAQLLSGSIHSDERGILKFFNDIDLAAIVRFYEIAPSSTKTIRAWQGHMEEKKWLYCLSGSFVVNLIKIDDFQNPFEQTKAERFVLSENDPRVLFVPGGYANGFKAETEGSKLMVFSNFSVTQTQKDDFRYPAVQWSAQW